MEVDPYKGATCLCGDSQSRPARATCDVEEFLPSGQVKPVEEHILLAGGHPAVLSYVFAKSFAADFRVKFGLKLAIVRVVTPALRFDLGVGATESSAELIRQGFLRSRRISETRLRLIEVL